MSENVEARRARWIAIALIGGSFLIRFCYVFLLTDYSHYLVSDMGGYWVRACERFDGDHNSYRQWAVWPPFFHVLLADLFVPFTQAKLPVDLWLTAVILLQITLSSFSVYWVYCIARRIFSNDRIALTAAVVYALTYTPIYFNAFLLSENLAIPLVIASVWLILQKTPRRLGTFCAGVLLGAAAGIRPADVLYAGAFALFLWATLRRPSGDGETQGAWRRLAPLLTFVLGFAGVVWLIVLENARISNGALWGLGANGGMNFFMAQCKIGRLDSNSIYHGYHYNYSFSHPQFFGETWREHVTTSVGLHEQGYFYHLGMQRLRDFATWREDFWELRKLLIGPIFPTYYTAWGFQTFDLLSRWTLTPVFLIALIAPPAARLTRRSWATREILLLWSILVLTFVTCFFFGNERRFIVPTIFAAEIITLSFLHRAWILGRSRLRRPRAGNTLSTKHSQV
jgi:hypothetical protein